MKCLYISGNEFEGQKQANLELDRTSAKAIQVSGLTIGVVRSLCFVWWHMPRGFTRVICLICVRCLWNDMSMIWHDYVYDVLVIWYMLWYDMLDDIIHVMIWYVHDMTWYVEWYAWYVMLNDIIWYDMTWHLYCKMIWCEGKEELSYII